MKYVALLSGGKDSCFNLVHCHKNGHELVAAASLGPEPGKEELDSFLYQTVGQDAVEFVARALDVPLYRRVITGSAVEQGLHYGTRDKSVREAGGVQGDETEDLYELLVSVKLAHPEIQGVSVGAILSNYQRIRVEHVCSRLGLTPLAYLWQRDQAELLNEMIEAGMEAILIKVAGIGLTPDHLGKSLAEMQPTLTKLNSQYGSHVCGEGGEYESLTIDSPLFKQRMSLKEVETVIHSDSAFATVAFLRVKDAVLQPKDSWNNSSGITVPPLLDEEFALIRDRLETEASPSDNAQSSSEFGSLAGEQKTVEATSKQVNNWVSICNVQCHVTDTDMSISLEDEVMGCFNILQDHLGRYNLKTSNCTNINIYLSSMDLFASMNAIYGKYFGACPPSRACIAVDLPDPIRVRLDCMAFTEKSSDRQALHVQGLSYWAPANIGPYSQAISAEERISVSGQIGLVPGNLTLPSPRSFPHEFALSAQHVARVHKALQSGWEGTVQSAIYFLDDPQNIKLAKKGHGFLQSPRSLTLFVVVKSLPRAALIEKQVLLHTGRCEVRDEENNPSMQVQEMTLKHGISYNSRIYYEAMGFEQGLSLDKTSFCRLIFVRGQEVASLKGALTSQNMKEDEVISARLYYKSSVASLLPDIAASCGFPITFVPCRMISSIEEDGWDYALHVIAH